MSIEKKENNEEKSTTSELEANALARSERLKQLRDQITNKSDANGKMDDGQLNEKKNLLVFRSYVPINVEGIIKKQTNEEKFTVLDKKIEDMIKDTHETNIIKDELDLDTLAPKKIDWDLKRGIQSKLDMLDKKTEKAISQLIRKRLEGGDSQLLPAAVNSAISSQFDDDSDDEIEL